MLPAIILVFLVAATFIMLTQFYCYKRYWVQLQDSCSVVHILSSTTPHTA